MRGQFAVGRRIGQPIYLRGIDADLALQQDQVFRLLILRRDQRLLLRLQLHLRAQLIQIRRGARLVRFVRVIFEHLRLRHRAFAFSTSLASAIARRYAVATCCTTSPRAVIFAKYDERSAAPAALNAAIAGAENNTCCS